jgi:adenine-specific DNA-methyltransferase
MSAADEIKLPLTSVDVNAERLAQLRQLYPEAFTEGKIDFPKLRQLFDEVATEAAERYGLSWSGKSEAIKNIQTLTSGTLLPARDESVNFDATENLIIEGDNLEVLKLLQGGYHGRVKMIYIDPPYNTGGDFIYPDNYKEGLADYLKFSGQASGEGVKLTTNPETDGRYHSKWLTMMYPRLFLARNLLREDGVIFVSIDDHEVHNLRAAMNEIFGEENFVAEICWRNVTDNNPTLVTKDNEFVLVFAKAVETLPQFWSSFVSDAKDTLQAEYKRLKSEIKSPALLEEQLRNFISDNQDVLENLTRYKNVDEKGVYTGSESVHNPRPGGYDFEVFHPVTKQPMRKPANGYRFPETTFREMEAAGMILYGEDHERIVKIKKYLDDFEDSLRSVIALDGRLGSYDLKRVFPDVEKVFTNPKPIQLLKSFVSFASSKDALILDFFAGSGTTAQAVMESNAQDGGNRKFILVQLPEPTERKDFPTIADITKERVRRVIKKLEEGIAAKEHKERKESEGQLPFVAAGVPPAVEGGILPPGTALKGSTAREMSNAFPPGGTPGSTAGETPAATPDLGFKVFKLSSSNFKVWDAASAPKDAAGLAEQLKLMAHNVVENRGDEALLYELVLKSNLPLTSKIASGKIGEQTFYDVADGALAICLERKITQETLRGIIERKPRGVICLDIAFAGNDQLKTNILLEMKSHGIEFHTA